MYNNHMNKETSVAISLVVRAAENHIKYIKPSAVRVEPKLYAGKVESTTITLLTDIFGVKVQDIPNRFHSCRACSAFNQQWRAHDEVLDEMRPTLEAPVTETELDVTPVFHKYAGRNVTGEESRQIAITSLREAIPGNDSSSRKRREKFEELLLAYRKRVADTANNPLYHQGEILTYPLALKSKEDVTGFLGTVGASLCAILLNRDDQPTIDFFRAASVVMQFGDDLLDWRKDLLDHEKIKKETGKKVRPIENLLVATLAENATEMADCRECLTNSSKRSVLWLKDLAPKTLEKFNLRFQEELDRLPSHKYADTAKAIISLTFNKLLPLAPESGWFFRWAKY